MYFNGEFSKDERRGSLFSHPHEKTSFAHNINLMEYIKHLCISSLGANETVQLIDCT